jgi:hypothetical protein
LRSICSALLLILLARLPSWSQEAAAVGLKGPVHTVLAEEFSNENDASSESRGSSFDVYDRHGNQLEGYRYKPDGSLWVHTVFSRDGERIFGWKTTGTAPFENMSVQNVFDAHGDVIETDTYDADGVLTKKATFEFLEKGTESTTFRSIESSVGGTLNTREVVENIDPKTGIIHQITTMDGKPETDWVIESDGNGTPEKDKILYRDGSYSERERKSDGTTVEDKYSASTKSHTYQTSDARGNLIEVIESSDSSYIRCTYSFDQTGRHTGQVNYDASGLILSKSTIEYRDDTSGNWTEKKMVDWDTKSQPMKQKIVIISLRTINYY